MYFLNNLQSNIKIIQKNQSNILDIEPILENDKDYHFMLKCDKERALHPENYGSMSDINWK